MRKLHVHGDGTNGLSCVERDLGTILMEELYTLIDSPFDVQGPFVDAARNQDVGEPTHPSNRHSPRHIPSGSLIQDLTTSCPR